MIKFQFSILFEICMQLLSFPLCGGDMLHIKTISNLYRKKFTGFVVCSLIFVIFETVLCQQNLCKVVLWFMRISH